MHFNWIKSDNNNIKWRDLTGPEKHRLFEKIDIPELFPIPNGKQLQELWDDFYNLIKQLSEDECDASSFEKSAKQWVNSFVSFYQRKDVTPYIHAHVPQFLHLYNNNIKIFTQQGLEKLNDITTKHFQRGTNHHDVSALKQILQKHIRLQTLEESGYQRNKNVKDVQYVLKQGTTNALVLTDLFCDEIYHQDKLSLFTLLHILIVGTVNLVYYTHIYYH